MTWVENPRIEIEVGSRVRGIWHGQPFTGLLVRKDGFGYRVCLDSELAVYCPEQKFRLGYIVSPPYAGTNFNIEAF